MKKIILLLTLALLSMPVLKSEAITVTEKDHGFISVTVSAAKEIEPDTASVSFSVETTAPTAQAAVNENNTKTEKLISALKPLISLDKSDTISTASIEVKPVYTTDKKGNKTFRHYKMENTIIVKIKDISKVSKLIDCAVENHATRVEDIKYYIENDDLYSAALIKEAAQKAESNADMTAKSLDKKLCGVKRIFVNCVQNRASAAYGANLVKSTPVQPQKVNMEVYVNADFYVK